MILSTKVNANIYSCNINGFDAFSYSFNTDIVITINNNSKEKILLSTDWDRLAYTDNDIIIANMTEQKIGKLIVTNSSSKMLEKNSYDLFASRNYKAGDDNYFVGVFNYHSGFLSTITISPWNMKVFLYLSEYPEKIFEGKCK